jgi:hypothetical protein
MKTFLLTPMMIFLLVGVVHSFPFPSGMCASVGIVDRRRCPKNRSICSCAIARVGHDDSAASRASSKPFQKDHCQLPRYFRAARRVVHLSRGGQQQASFSHSTTTTTTSTTRSTLLAATKATSAEGTSALSSSPWNVSSSSYHLLWSPGFRKHLGIAITVLAAWRFLLVPQLDILHHAHYHSSSSSSTMAGCCAVAASVTNHPLISNVLLPLLSSACCILQVWINVLVGTSGCAGFNTYLGPVRPYFLTVLAYLTALSPPSRWVVATTVGRGMIAFLPEILHVWNERRQQQPQRALDTRAGLTASVAGSSSPNGYRATLEFEIPTMGCVACINKIDSSLRQTGMTASATTSSSSQSSMIGIETARAWLEADPQKKGGRARVELSGVTSQEELNAMAESMLQSIQGAGFGGCRVVERTMEGSNS